MNIDLINSSPIREKKKAPKLSRILSHSTKAILRGVAFQYDVASSSFAVSTTVSTSSSANRKSSSGLRDEDTKGVKKYSLFFQCVIFQSNLHSLLRRYSREETLSLTSLFNLNVCLLKRLHFFLSFPLSLF
jgi:hypothetical protein